VGHPESEPKIPDHSVIRQKPTGIATGGRSWRESSAGLCGVFVLSETVLYF
jgi:hypothetical protein